MAFDIDQYAASSEPVAWGDLDFSIFKNDPLDADTLAVVKYMCEVEYHTVCYLRDMLVTPSHSHPEVGTFMTIWNREEYWHGAALADVLAQHDITIEYDQLKANRMRLGWRDRLDPIKQSLLGNIVGKDFVAVHMAWGMCNERSAAAAYRRLADMQPHPALAPLLKRIAQQETRHIAFYTKQAEQRLLNNPKAQKLTRTLLNKFWGPVGSGAQPQAEVEHVMGYMFKGEDGLREIRKLDEQIARLPGLQGLHLMERAFQKHGMVLG